MKEINTTPLRKTIIPLEKDAITKGRLIATFSNIFGI